MIKVSYHRCDTFLFEVIFIICLDGDGILWYNEGKESMGG